MKRVTAITVVACLLLLASWTTSHGQEFPNADFEEPILPLDPRAEVVPIANALPYWVGTLGSRTASNIYFNDRALSAAAISLHSSDSKIHLPLQGNYSVVLQGSGPFDVRTDSASIARTAFIPFGSRSLQFNAFRVRGDFEVSFGGETLSLVPLVNFPGYIRYGADITRFSGLRSELRFTAPPIGTFVLDSIQFSPVAVPEPGLLALGVMGLGILAWRYRKKRMPTKLVHLSLLLFAVNFGRTSAQSLFNSNFETPILPLLPQFGSVPIVNALPGWRGYINDSQLTEVIFNSRNLDAASISIHTTNSSYTPIAGGYSVLLQGSSSTARVVASASIAQTAEVPPDRLSLRFTVRGGHFQVSLGGETLSLYQLVVSSDDTLYGASLAGFAGGTHELRFTALPRGLIFLDNIGFSTLPVPEPGTLALTALGLGVLAWRRVNQRSLNR